MTAAATRSVVHDSFAIERTYPATPERVFAAWAIAENRRQWFGVSDGEGPEFTGHLLDFTVGGREHLEGSVPNGPTFTYDAVFNDIVEGERIVYTYDMHMDGRRMSVSVATVEIIGVAGGTTLILTEQGAYLDGLDTNAQRHEGTEELLTALGNHLAAAAAEGTTT